MKIWGNGSDVNKIAPMALEASSGWRGEPAGSMAFAVRLQAFQMSI